MLIVDYFSKYIEISKLDNETSHEVVLRLKSVFARHGIPQEVFSDNGPHSAVLLHGILRLRKRVQVCPYYQQPRISLEQWGSGESRPYY